MARELAAYRENLQDILEFTGGKRLLNITDVCKYLGMTRPSSVKRLVPFNKNYISAASLAKALSLGVLSE